MLRTVVAALTLFAASPAAAAPPIELVGELCYPGPIGCTETAFVLMPDGTVPLSPLGGANWRYSRDTGTLELLFWSGLYGVGERYGDCVSGTIDLGLTFDVCRA